VRRLKYHQSNSDTKVIQINSAEKPNFQVKLLSDIDVRFLLSHESTSNIRHLKLISRFKRESQVSKFSQILTGCPHGRRRGHGQGPKRKAGD